MRVYEVHVNVYNESGVTYSESVYEVHVNVYNESGVTYSEIAQVQVDFFVLGVDVTTDFFALRVRFTK